MTLETKHTALAAAGAVTAWLAMLVLVVQLAYSYDLYWLLNKDFEVLAVVLAGLSVTLLVIFWRSVASYEEKLTIGLVSVFSLVVLSWAGGLMVSCANDNCL